MSARHAKRASLASYTETGIFWISITYCRNYAVESIAANKTIDYLLAMPSNARCIASLTISFGLVAIPVKLYSATVSSERISFNLLRKKDGSRVRQQYVAVNDGVLDERVDMTKGYEFSKHQYGMFSAEELKALEDETTHTIDIGEFVPLESVDPVYFDKTYYLAPDKGGAKPYSLLAIGLKKAKLCALGVGSRTARSTS